MAENEARFSMPGEDYHSRLSFLPESPVNRDTSMAHLSSNLLEKDTLPLEIDIARQEIREIFEADAELSRTHLSRITTPQESV